MRQIIGSPAATFRPRPAVLRETRKQGLFLLPPFGLHLSALDAAAVTGHMRQVAVLSDMPVAAPIGGFVTRSPTQQYALDALALRSRCSTAAQASTRQLAFAAFAIWSPEFRRKPMTSWQNTTSSCDRYLVMRWIEAFAGVE